MSKIQSINIIYVPKYTVLYYDNAYFWNNKDITLSRLNCSFNNIKYEHEISICSPQIWVGYIASRDLKHLQRIDTPFVYRDEFGEVDYGEEDGSCIPFFETLFPDEVNLEYCIVKNDELYKTIRLVKPTIAFNALPSFVDTDDFVCICKGPIDLVVGDDDSIKITHTKVWVPKANVDSRFKKSNSMLYGRTKGLSGNLQISSGVTWPVLKEYTTVSVYDSDYYGDLYKLPLGRDWLYIHAKSVDKYFWVPREFAERMGHL